MTTLSGIITPSNVLTATNTQTVTNKTINGSNNTLTNVSISTAVSGLGTNVAAFLGTPSSANLASALTDETGSGLAVFNANPLLTTLRETATISATAATSTINYDVITQSVLYYTTNASGNWTLNIRGNSGTTLDSIMSTGQVLTVTFLVTNGATPYYQTALNIDGSAVTPEWQGGAAPTAGNANSIDAYTAAIIKTGSATFTVLESFTQFA